MAIDYLCNLSNIVRKAIGARSPSYFKKCNDFTMVFIFLQPTYFLKCKRTNGVFTNRVCFSNYTVDIIIRILVVTNLTFKRSA